MANNNFDIKVFTDELNKAFTILKKEQVLEKYMKKILLNYNSIIYIDNITNEPNKYDAIYKYMYGEDNTLCNIVVFETDGFVDSATNLISSGYHIATPYQDNKILIDRYLNNGITEAVVIGGLEPLDTFEDTLQFIKDFREKSDDDIVIYTGFNEDEIEDKIVILKKFKNIIVKFGRYRPNFQKHFDAVIGVELASPNQYAKRIS